MEGESIGGRIARLRGLKGWSRPELGRQMAKAIGRAKPYTGEQVRLYEIDKNKPPPEARRALALVFGKNEPYIEFGDTSQKQRVAEPGGADYNDPDRARNAREGILLHLYRGLFSLQQERLIVGLRALFDANQITRKELGNKALTGVSDDDVRRAFGDAPFQRMKKIERKTPPPRRDQGTAMDDFFEE